MPRLVVVDRDHAVCAHLQQALARHGISARCVTPGHLGLRISAPELIIMRTRAVVAHAAQVIYVGCGGERVSTGAVDHHLPLTYLIRVLQSMEATGTLTFVNSHGARAQVALSGGAIASAHCGAIDGQRALDEVSRWASARYEYWDGWRTEISDFGGDTMVDPFAETAVDPFGSAGATQVMPQPKFQAPFREPMITLRRVQARNDDFTPQDEAFFSAAEKLHEPVDNFSDLAQQRQPRSLWRRFWTSSHASADPSLRALIESSSDLIRTGSD